MTAPWYTIRPGQGGERAEAHIIGFVGDAPGAQQFADELQALPPGDIVVRISSNGGDFAACMAVHNALRRHPGMVTTVVDAHAFGESALIAMAGTRRVMASNGILMLRGPANGQRGRSHTAALAARCSDATGRPVAEFDALLTSGERHLYSAQEAIAAGLVHEINDGAILNTNKNTPVTYIRTTEDERDKFTAAASRALMARAGMRGPDGKPIAHEPTNPLRGMTLMELAKAAIRRNGRSPDGMDPTAVVGYAFQSTSDFPALLQDVMHKSLQAGYATAPDTWSKFCAAGSVTDFRAHNRYRLGSLANIAAKNENGEYKHLTIPDGERAIVSASDHGAIVSISREMIINDDMQAFTRLPMDMGRAVSRSIESDVYALLTSNPLLADGLPLFHASRGNLAGTGTAPSVVSVDSGRMAMSSHRDAQNNDFLDLLPVVALSPKTMGSLLRVINGAAYDPDTANVLQRPNAVLNLFRDVIDSPRLSGTAWYMFADADVAPVLEVSFLNGDQTPKVEQESHFTTGGGRMRVQLDWGVNAVDYRGAWKNPGA